MRYHPQAGNPNIETVYGYTPGASSYAAADAGRILPPGRHAGTRPGRRASHCRPFVDGYLRANERDDEFGVKEIYLPTIPATHDEFHRHRPDRPGHGREIGQA